MGTDEERQERNLHENFTAIFSLRLSPDSTFVSKLSLLCGVRNSTDLEDLKLGEKFGRARRGIQERKLQFVMISEKQPIASISKRKVKGFSLGFNALDAEMSQMVRPP